MCINYRRANFHRERERERFVARVCVYIGWWQRFTRVKLGCGNKRARGELVGLISVSASGRPLLEDRAKRHGAIINVPIPAKASRPTEPNRAPRVITDYAICLRTRVGLRSRRAPIFLLGCSFQLVSPAPIPSSSNETLAFVSLASNFLGKPLIASIDLQRSVMYIVYLNSK